MIRLISRLYMYGRLRAFSLELTNSLYLPASLTLLSFLCNGKQLRREKDAILMERADDSEPLKVTFSGPAKYFTDAAPIGNGRLGAMVWVALPQNFSNSTVNHSSPLF
ncbi:hypothetical protein NL676_015757 [Syzygium grande]|nr:hypothetical protein NL676_015757 [Syzygium grande]